MAGILNTRLSAAAGQAFRGGRSGGEPPPHSIINAAPLTGMRR